ncbi:hypothetical protein [Acaryochloris marina]|uniref:hypothetical protein n=1 Tax=Acaryochloris marina TaxID=155978 RepID=UPI0021C31D75|nr:hypothetical protein [Acaryochloris marina]BDM83560.1 hypothetical protein AM10699_64210 [Acaryochloris marina MBIC10699]
MADIQLEIEGKGAIAASEALFNIEGLSGSYIAEEGDSKELALSTIASIVGITAGSMTIAKHLYDWYQRISQGDTETRIEKVVLIDRKGKRMLMKNATLEEIQKALES